MTWLASTTVLYSVGVVWEITIPIIYLVSLIVCVLLREFTKGWLKYTLALAFAASFSVLWFIISLDYTPWQYVSIGAVVLGCVSGLWSWVREAIKDVEKL